MAEKVFRLEIIAPDRVFYDQDVYMAEYNTTEGEVGILDGHIPMTQVLAPGVLTITESENQQKKAALHSGFVEITGKKVTILAESVEWPEEIDLKRAEEARIRAQRRLEEKENINLERAELALKRALIRENVASRP